jgi:hypothetical protein
MESGWFKVVIPHIYIHAISLRRLRAPQFARGETHRIHMLRLLAEEMRVGVRKNENAVVTIDRSYFAARVPRQPGMSHGIDVAGAHSLSDFKE